MENKSGTWHKLNKTKQKNPKNGEKPKNWQSKIFHGLYTALCDDDD